MQTCGSSASGRPADLWWDLGRDMRGWLETVVCVSAVVQALHSHWEAPLHGFQTFGSTSDFIQSKRRLLVQWLQPEVSPVPPTVGLPIQVACAPTIWGSC